MSTVFFENIDILGHQNICTDILKYNATTSFLIINLLSANLKIVSFGQHSVLVISSQINYRSKCYKSFFHWNASLSIMRQLVLGKVTNMFSDLILTKIKSVN